MENAIKHGISQMLEPGCITIRAQRQDDLLTVTVEDSAGLYQPQPESDGLGLNLVNRRIKLRYGEAYGVTVSCERERFTRVAIALPLENEALPC